MEGGGPFESIGAGYWSAFWDVDFYLQGNLLIL